MEIIESETYYPPLAVDGGELMVDLLERITINPDQCGGRPCIRGMCVRVFLDSPVD